MIIISAMTENRVIGSGDYMPWNVPEEYQQYLNFVKGNTVIMGRKSFEIFGKDLSSETTPIVVSRSAEIEKVPVEKSLEAAIEHAKKLEKTVFIAGGGSIYKMAIPLVDSMYLSTIKGSYQGDVFFPEFSMDDWNITEERDEKNFIFRIYQRKR